MNILVDVLVIYAAGVVWTCFCFLLGMFEIEPTPGVSSWKILALACVLWPWMMGYLLVAPFLPMPRK